MHERVRRELRGDVLHALGQRALVCEQETVGAADVVDLVAGETPAAPPKDAPAPLQVGDLRLDPSRRSATLDGDELDLTRKEFELLELLMREAGSVITRERLIDEVWDVNWFGSTKTLDVHVSGLRRKLGDDPSSPRYLHTVRGVGFRFSGPEELETGPER